MKNLDITNIRHEKVASIADVTVMYFAGSVVFPFNNHLTFFRPTLPNPPHNTTYMGTTILKLTLVW